MTFHYWYGRSYKIIVTSHEKSVKSDVWVKWHRRSAYYNTSHYNTRVVSKLWMDIRKVFGANVRRYRIAADLTQDAIAVRMGVDRAYISLIERGGQNATLISLLEIAQALRVKPAQLIDDDGDDVGSIPKPRPAEPGGV